MRSTPSVIYLFSMRRIISSLLLTRASTRRDEMPLQLDDSKNQLYLVPIALGAVIRLKWWAVAGVIWGRSRV